MPKFKLICDNSYSLDTHVVTHEFSGEYLPDILDNIRMFLQGAGFVIDGVIDVIPNDEYYGTPQQELFDDTELISKSHHYFDTERNR